MKFAARSLTLRGNSDVRESRYSLIFVESEIKDFNARGWKLLVPNMLLYNLNISVFQINMTSTVDEHAERNMVPPHKLRDRRGQRGVLSPVNRLPESQSR